MLLPLTTRGERDTGGRRQPQRGVRYVVQFVLLEQPLDGGYVRGRDIRDEEVLVRGEAERAFVHLSDRAQARLKVTLGLVLDAPVLDETREVVVAVLVFDPAKVVRIACEGVRSRGLELPAKQLLHLRLEDVKAHAVDRVFQTGILRVNQY